MRTFDRLVLLVGTNPLPNLVVADYFLKTPNSVEKIYLIHSESRGYQKGTLEEAIRLEEILKERHSDRKGLFPLQKISLSDVSNAREIRQDLKDKLLSKLPNGCKIHLNYTGGTKAMGIHVYDTLKEARGISEKSFSYLDARTFRIVDDDKGITTEDLRDTTKITFSEMIRLHGLERKNKDKDTSEFSDTLNFFKSLIEIEKDSLDTYFNDYDRKLFENKKGGLAEKIKDLKEETKQTQISGKLLEAFKALPEDWRFFDSNGVYVEPKDKNIKSPLMYLDGIWLEDYVYEVLKEGYPDLDFYKNWEIKKEEWRPDSKFEIDVIALRGYQLIGISCTTADILSLCKSKGFEILLRTRQIGGDEAKAVLVTRLPEDKVVILQASLIADTAGSDNILVLGNKDLKREQLIERFKDFIK
ncbi:MAG TPA: hypothetical protein PKW07_10900 [Syntrophorhabdaceae bacterium]|nr:hypothetical protein [Syntrophorhabdaceae bacterium]